MVFVKVLFVLALITTSKLLDAARKNIERENEFENVLSVMTWNLLARKYTKYNKEHHQTAVNIANGIETKVETQAQTHDRYNCAAKKILEQGSDIVFLQECAGDFFDTEEGRAILNEYYKFQCPPVAMGEEDVGTAVLLKKNGNAAPLQDVEPRGCIGGTDDEGGSSKVATVIPVRIGTKEVNVISSHFTFNGNAAKRMHHLEEIEEALEEFGRPTILGGDFNCDSRPGHSGGHFKEVDNKFHEMKMQHVAIEDFTGLDGRTLSKPEVIDHVFISTELIGGDSGNILVAKSLASDEEKEQGKPAIPWVQNGEKARGMCVPLGRETAMKQGDVQSPSDHAPVLVVIKLT